MALNFAFDGADLSGVHAMATLIGMVLVVALMQMSWHTGLALNEPAIMKHARRFGMVALAMVLWWSFSFALDKGWQPWPPHLAMVIVLDALLGINVLSAWLRIRAHSSKARSNNKNRFTDGTPSHA